MNAIARLRSWWKAVVHRAVMNSELEIELRFHVEARAEDLAREGVPRDQALRRARLELGSAVLQKENIRASIGLRPLDDLVADIRYAFRQLRHTPAFTATVLLVLALGIGANAAMFSIIDATLLRWLPYQRPSELVSLNTVDESGRPSWSFYSDLQEWQSQTRTLSSLAYYYSDRAYLDASGARQTISASRVSANLFTVLGVQPSMGRSFFPQEQIPGNTHEVILSERVWRTLLGGDGQILGKQISLDEVPHTVVGVMPSRFIFPSNDASPQVWLPAEIKASDRVRDFTATSFNVIARLGPGMKPDTARTEVSGIQQRLTPLYTGYMTGTFVPSKVEVTRYRESLVRHARPALLALVGAVLVIWLIACANVANLMLARGVARQREIAVRGSLGAGKWRIIRQLFTESFLLSAAGAGCGLLLAQIVLRIFEKTLSAKLDLPLDLAPNPFVLFALLGLSSVSAIIFGLLPAFLAARTPLEHALRQSSAQAGLGRQRQRLQQGMVVAEIGLSLVLLVACGLLLRTVFELRKVPLGFRTDHVLLVIPQMPEYKTRGIDINLAVHRPLLERVRRIPGVSAASLTTVAPLRQSFESTISFYIKPLEKSPSSDPGRQFQAKLMASEPELQRVLGFKMYEGRYFNEHDAPDAQPVAVVNRAFARLYSPDSSVIGKMNIGLAKDRSAKIVGVMEDFHQATIDKPPMPEIDFCSTQLRQGDGFYQPTLQAHVELALRTSRDPKTLIPDLRRAMAELNSDLESSLIETMDQVVEDSIGSQLLAAHLLELFAGAALVIALSGLYGLLSYLVAQRTQELGVRLALGAQRVHIVEMLLGQAGRMLFAGAALGIILAYFSGRLLAGFLYGVKPHDLWTMFGVTALLLFSGLLAAFLPARRASRLDPLKALRQE
jgi:predicted permease